MKESLNLPTIKKETLTIKHVHRISTAFLTFLNNNSDGPVSYQLHEFCDSSSVCYAAVAYLRVETEVRTSSVKDKSSSTF